VFVAAYVVFVPARGFDILVTYLDFCAFLFLVKKSPSFAFPYFSPPFAQKGPLVIVPVVSALSTAVSARPSFVFFSRTSLFFLRPSSKLSSDKAPLISVGQRQAFCISLFLILFVF